MRDTPTLPADWADISQVKDWLRYGLGFRERVTVIYALDQLVKDAEHDVAFAELIGEFDNEKEGG